MSTRKFAPLETEIWNLIGWQSQRGWLCWIETYWFKKKTTRLAVLARNLQEKKYPRKRRSETEAVRRANAAGCVCSKPTRRKMYPRTRRSETEAVRRANAAGCVETYKLKQNGHPRKRRSETEALGRANAAGCVGSKPTGSKKTQKEIAPSETEIGSGWQSQCGWLWWLETYMMSHAGWKSQKV